MAHPPAVSILIVEDAEACSATLEVALDSLAGCVVTVVTSAEAAMTVLKRSPATAVITDLHLPGLNGFDLIRHIRSRLGEVQPIIFVVSGDTDPATPQRVLDLGADAFFVKPYSPSEVRRTLERLIHVT